MRLPATLTLAVVLLAISCSTSEQVALEPSADVTPTGLSTEAVVLVIIDGLRYSEGLGDPEHRFTPNMTALAEEGAIVEPFLNDGVTRTVRAIPAIWSGTWAAPEQFADPACNGGQNNRATAPTIFEYYRKHLARPAEDCVYVVGNVGCTWKGSAHPDYGSSFWPRYVESGNSDAERWTLAKQILEDDEPGFMLLYLPDVDHQGHSRSWPGYTRAIVTADRIVGELWDFLEASSHYSGRTTMIVTNDHGRHNNRPQELGLGFSGHGDDCSGCRTIQCLVIGPDTPAGLVSTRSRSIPDIAPTIGALLGFGTEVATGSPMLELLPTEP